jgi:transcriptional regulator with XRE-family HTH domain
MRSTTHNRQAGSYLRLARLASGCGQESLALRLSEHLGLKMSGSQLSYYESGTHVVPAAVLLAVAELTSMPIAGAEHE